MSTVLIATGGTIACTHDEAGALVPTRSAADLVALLDERTHSEGVHAIDFRRLDSSEVTLADLDELIAVVAQQCEQPDVDKVVITHGTDSLEETAAALALFHSSATPVIITGSQYPYDDPEGDGPTNLRGAFAVDTPGVSIHFGGVTTPAWGSRKVHTTGLQAFSLSDVPSPTPLSPAPLASVTVSIIAAYPGIDGQPVRAALEAGAQGLVIEALGSGNVSSALGQEILDALAAGIPVVLSTRVAQGAAAGIYGGTGGGATLCAAGAVSSGLLRAGQARIALAAAIATSTSVAELF